MVQPISSPSPHQHRGEKFNAEVAVSAEEIPSTLLFFPRFQGSPGERRKSSAKTSYLSHKQKVFVKIMYRSFLSLLKSRERLFAASATMEHLEGLWTGRAFFRGLYIDHLFAPYIFPGLILNLVELLDDFADTDTHVVDDFCFLPNLFG